MMPVRFDPESAGSAWTHAAAPRALIGILDDDEAVRDALSASLAAAGFEVLAFTGAQDLLNWAEPRRLACLLVDADLAGIRAGDLLRALLGRQPAFPVIFMTARLRPSLELDTLAGGPVRILHKPFGEDELMRDLGSLLGADVGSGPDSPAWGTG